GEYAAARPLYERALAIREKGLGSEHPDVAVALHNLSTVFKGLGDYEAARRHDERALRILEKALGPDHDDVAAILSSLGDLHTARGDLTTARRLLDRVLRIREKALGPEHPHLAFALNNLGALLIQQGDYAAAHPLFLRSLEILEKQHGPGHPDLAQPLNNLARIADVLGDLPAARARYERALEIRRQALGEDSPDVALSLANLAGVLTKQGDLPTANRLLEQALSLQERALGREHSAVADTLEKMAEVRLRQGDVDSTEDLAERALSIAQGALGSDHPQVARTLRTLAALELRRGRPDRARELLLQAAGVVDRHVQQVFPDLSLAEQRAFLASQIPEQTAALLSVCAAAPCDPADIYPALLRWKGLLVESLRRQRLVSRLAADPRLAPRIDLLWEARARLAALHQQAGSLARADWQARYAESTARKEQLERELAGELPAEAREDPLGPSPLSSLTGALRPGEALVDIYSHADTRGERFTALMTTPDGRVRRLDLGEAETLRGAVRRWRQQVRERSPAEEAWHDLARRVWSPIAAVSSGLSRIWVSPDGELARIPWQLLPETDPRTAKVLASQLDSPRELILLHRMREPG
ncbi:MAG: tetratricopeptide repeat protein, partial [Thermoanaerobaculia bacterium]